MIFIVTGEFTMLILQKYGFKVCVILFAFIKLVLKFISIYPASTHSEEHEYNSKSHTSSNVATSKGPDCIKGDPIVTGEIVTLA